ncbi:hypothetical protein Afil01_19790 [Actinorhabdospora filicis]|uniref:Uncharacterized protein n=1 Tax=Actinorhabdospora filicis TaxID=1785913 RepID=A0A9W6SJN2_9ACTN|nr:hypothetical protein [Actinorhabdospora filicis]GLZ77172.1 hypothetical protein Afil01_19790 [Actinorhabdospora filicis]
MSAPMYAPMPQPPKPPRPGVVSAAGFLQFGVAAFALVTAVATFIIGKSITDDLTSALMDAGAPSQSQAQDFATVVVFTMGAVGFCGLIWPGVVALLGIWTMKGVNGVRITVWVLAGIAVLCDGIAVLASGLTTSQSLNLNNGTDDYKWAQNVDIQKLMPEWYDAYGAAVNGIALLMYVGIIVLLALPKANEYFRPVPKFPQQPVYLPYDPGTTKS